MKILQWGLTKVLYVALSHLVYTAMGVPYLSSGTYRKYRDRLYKGFLLVSDEDTENAAKLEEAIAHKKGNVVDDIACISVTGDGA